MSDLRHETEPQRTQNRPTLPSVKTILGVTFGIFMVIIYVGMGILLMINFFGWTQDWDVCRWVVGVVLIIYGIYRGRRQYKDFTTDYDYDI